MVRSIYPLTNAFIALTPPQLPLGLLTAAQGHPMLVELKNGETLNGHLVQCDTYMNLTLKEVVQTSPDGDKFFRLPECYVRGNNVSQCSRMRLKDIVIILIHVPNEPPMQPLND